MSTITLILGASDPEMTAIEELGRQVGAEIRYALSARGERVRADEAYRVAALDALLPPDGTVYAIECDGPAIPAGAVRIDHHRPGDPGYGRPPAEFLPASSIGQVIAELAKTGALRRVIQHEIAHWMASHDDLPVAEYNEMLRTQWFWSRQEDMPGPDPYPSDGTIARGVSWIYDGYAVAVHRNDFYFERRVALIPPPLICAAAADHCLAAAYRGECPGVDPDALMRWRAESRGRTVDEVLADVERARELLEDAPNERLAHGVYVADMRGYGHVPELPEAALREGVAYLTTVTDRDGRHKVVLGGHTTPEMVKAFVEKWAPSQGLVDIYGDPARGYAGGYLAARPSALA